MVPFDEHNRIKAACLIVLLAGLVLGGCASTPATGRPEAATTKPSGRTGLLASIDTRSGMIEAVVGRAAVAPVSLTGPLPTSGKLTARLEDGRPVATTLLWLVIEPSAHGRWIPTPTWRTLPATSSSVPDTPGRWVVLIELPIDAVGQSLWLDGKRRSIQWLPSPETLTAGLVEESQPIPEPWTSPLSPDALRSASLRSELDLMRTDPFSAWRAELALGELWDQHTQPRRASSRSRSSQRTTDRALEVLTEHQRSRWLAVLATAWQLDPTLAIRLRDALIPCVRMGQAAWLPVWGSAGEADELDRLADAVLSRDLSDDVKAERIERWLSDQPGAITWVIDDAGGSVIALEHQRAGPTIGVANLRAVASLAWVDSATGTDDGPAVSDAPPLAVTRVQLPASSASARTLSVHCGSWVGSTSLGSSRIEVRPPGLVIGPFASGWTAPAWLSGDPAFAAAEPGGFRSIGQLYPKTDSAGDLHWTVLIECDAPPGTTGDELRLLLGPMGEPTSVYSASPSWGVRTVMGEAPRSAQVVRDTKANAGSWRFEIELPDAAVSSDGLLLVGAVRLSEGTALSSWPRRMTPWQAEPGRLPIDLTHWQSVLPATSGE